MQFNIGDLVRWDYDGQIYHIDKLDPFYDDKKDSESIVYRLKENECWTSENALKKVDIYEKKGQLSILDFGIEY